MFEDLQLVLAGQLAEDQQESYFQERTVLSQLLNWDSPVLKYPFISINVGDPGDAVHGVHVGRVVAPGYSP